MDKNDEKLDKLIRACFTLVLVLVPMTFTGMIYGFGMLKGEIKTLRTETRAAQSRGADISKCEVERNMTWYGTTKSENVRCQNGQ